MRRFQAAASHDLGLEGSFWPAMVEPSRSDLLSEISKAIRLLRPCMAMAMLRYRRAFPLGLHAKVAAADLKMSLLNLKHEFLACERQNEVGKFQITACAAHVGPLLMARHKCAVK